MGLKLDPRSLLIFVIFIIMEMDAPVVARLLTGKAVTGATMDTSQVSRFDIVFLAIDADPAAVIIQMHGMSRIAIAEIKYWIDQRIAPDPVNHRQPHGVKCQIHK